MKFIFLILFNLIISFTYLHSSNLEFHYNIFGNNIKHTLNTEDLSKNPENIIIPKGKYNFFIDYELLHENKYLLKSNRSLNKFKNKANIDFNHNNDYLIFNKNFYDEKITFKYNGIDFDIDTKSLKNNQLINTNSFSLSSEISQKLILNKNLNQVGKLKDKGIKFFLAKKFRLSTDDIFRSIDGNKLYFNFFLKNSNFDFLNLKINEDLNRITFRYVDENDNYLFKNFLPEKNKRFKTFNDISNYIFSDTETNFYFKQDLIFDLPKKFKNYNFLDVIIELEPNDSLLIENKESNIPLNISTYNLNSDKDFTQIIKNYRVFEFDQNHLGLELNIDGFFKDDAGILEINDKKFAGTISKNNFDDKLSLRLPKQVIETIYLLEKITKEKIFTDGDFIYLPKIDDKSLFFDFRYLFSLKNISNNFIPINSGNKRFKVLDDKLLFNDINNGLELRNFENKFFLEIDIEKLSHSNFLLNIVGENTFNVPLDLYDENKNFIKTLDSNESFNIKDFTNLNKNKKVYFKINKYYQYESIIIKNLINYSQHKYELSEITNLNNYFIFENLKISDFRQLLKKNKNSIYSFSIKVNRSNKCDYLIQTSKGIKSLCSDINGIININNLTDIDLTHSFNFQFPYTLIDNFIIIKSNYEKYIDNLNFFFLTNFTKNYDSSNQLDFQNKNINFKINEKDENNLKFKSLVNININDINLDNIVFDDTIISDFIKSNNVIKLNKFIINRVEPINLDQFDKFNLFFEKEIDRVDGGVVKKQIVLSKSKSISPIYYLTLFLILGFLILFFRLRIKLFFHNIKKYLIFNFNFIDRSFIHISNKLSIMSYLTIYLLLTSILLTIYFDYQFYLLLNILYIVVSFNISYLIFKGFKNNILTLFTIFSFILFIDFFMSSIGIKTFEIMFSVIELVFLISILVFKVKENDKSLQ